ncbi:T9SS type A sorting domain-containing protein [Flavobacterium zepuense]|uniref:T9SS type A sorting domain-containing protein n=1 Tax=Flavobacterium zepuense TaxID=2593302 RepID=A0A552UYS7_9FLAO|nr:T9SS type A sorting domain-containing protein [Flavobacterium zepuense]TRW23377.1 T9SS type A sorting domain-containing protein [Flavobacterium zepuense]
MKKIYILAFALSGLVANAQFSDDFESYTSGDQLLDGHWSSWSGNASEAIEVSSDEASGGDLSGYIGDTGQDALLLLGNKTSGTYTVQFDMLIPADRWAFYGFMDAEDTESEFSLSMYANFFTNAQGQLAWGFNTDDGFTAVALADFVPEEWFTVTHEINLDDNTVVIKKDDVVLFEGDFPSAEASFGQIDFWSLNNETDGNNNTYYIDNIQYVEGTLSTKDIIANKDALAVYTNNNVLNIAGQENISDVTLFNIAGQQVAHSTPNSVTAQVNLDNLSTGIYVAKIAVGNKTVTKKISVN